MFRNGFLESLSKVHFSVPLIIYVPVILYFCWKALWQVKMGFWLFIACYAGGIFLWSLTEYVLHRFVFHYVPKSKWGQKLHFIFHGVHHDYPKDKMRLVMPPSVSIPLAFGFYALFSALVSEAYLYAVFPGFVTGYLCYDMIHYAVHHVNINNGIWLKIKKHHMLHHYSDASKGYGVSSSFWDKVFRSDFIKK